MARNEELCVYPRATRLSWHSRTRGFPSLPHERFGLLQGKIIIEGNASRALNHDLATIFPMDCTAGPIIMPTVAVLGCGTGGFIRDHDRFGPLRQATLLAFAGGTGLQTPATASKGSRLRILGFS